MKSFQDGLRTSPHFRGQQIAKGGYGNGETHETVFQKFAATDLQHSPSALDVFNDEKVQHMDLATPEGRLKYLASDAAICCAKMNFALAVGAKHGFQPLADAAPYCSLLSAKYKRSIASLSSTSTQVTATDLSLAILDEFLPNELVTQFTIRDAITLRQESSVARGAFLEHLSTLQAKLGETPADGNYGAAIQKITPSARLCTTPSRHTGCVRSTTTERSPSSPALVFRRHECIRLGKLSRYGLQWFGQLLSPRQYSLKCPSVRIQRSRKPN
jgi:hypothetical protein